MAETYLYGNTAVQLIKRFPAALSEKSCYITEFMSHLFAAEFLRPGYTFVTIPQHFPGVIQPSE